MYKACADLIGKRREKAREDGVWVCANLIGRWGSTPLTVGPLLL